MRVMKFISLILIVLTISAFAAAKTPARLPPIIKHVPITNAPSNSGKEMFASYCAVCHGTDGKGNGPAASAMKTPPADLTLLAQKNGGKYPCRSRRRRDSRTGSTMPSHGNAGYAGLGSAVLQHEPGSRRPGAAENLQSG